MQTSPNREQVPLKFHIYPNKLIFLFKHILFQFFPENVLGISFYNIICALSLQYTTYRITG